MNRASFSGTNIQNKFKMASVTRYSGTPVSGYPDLEAGKSVIHLSKLPQYPDTHYPDKNMSRF